ncbi:GAP family protein [Nocardia sp. NPDC051832]|uniref:GAP family protein n=1 Tax=Nocardia sp. NPDC051832 TaxID=3155673 RepID=UPI003437D648
MLTLLLALAGFAFLDSLDVLVAGVMTAVVVDSRLARRSPVPGGLSFLAGVFAITTTFGVGTVLGFHALSGLIDIELTPSLRYWGELGIGLALIAVAALPVTARAQPPEWTVRMRRRPWLLGLAGMAIGLAQAPTAVPYVAGLAMISAQDPPGWPLIVIAYCALALLPPLLILLIGTRRTPRARLIYRGVVRAMTRYGPMSVRILFVLLGAALLVDALRHAHQLW